MSRKIVRGVTKNCRALDPSKCKYHGEAYTPVSFGSLTDLFEKVDKELAPSLVIPASTPNNAFRQYEESLAFESQSLELEERHALHCFSDEYGSNNIRTVLMNPDKKYDFNGESMESIHARIQTLDNILRKYSQSVEGETLWRGVKGFDHELANLQIGSVFTNRSYTSTSTNPEIAVSFSKKEAPILFRIKAKEGYRVGGQFVSEQEVLLKRDSSFRVVDIQENVHLERSNPRFGDDPRVRGITLVDVEEVK